MQQTGGGKFRIEAIDLARGLAILAMAVFHFAWDLEFFGYARAGLTRETGWMLFARGIASSFLFLVGVSLYLAHGHKLRPASFLKRFAMVAGAAAAITAVTWYALPAGFIFFGILHQIALASLLGLAFLRLPVMLTLAAAAFVLAAPHFLRHEFFDHPLLWWVGLSSVNPHANDYVPLFPWFAPVLLGIAAARLAEATGLVARLAELRPGDWTRPLQAAGRNSLAIYLLHQPVLIASIWLFAQVAPPAPQIIDEETFLRECRVECVAVEGEEFCRAYCACMLDRIKEEGMMEQVYRGTDPAFRQWLEGVAVECSAISRAPQSQEEMQ